MNSTVSSAPGTILLNENEIFNNFDRNSTLYTYEKQVLQKYSKLNGFKTLQLCPRSEKKKQNLSVDTEFPKSNETSGNYLSISESSKKNSSRENSGNKTHRTVLTVRRFRSASFLQGKKCLIKTSAITKNRLLKRRKFSSFDIYSGKCAKYSRNLEQNIEIVKDNEGTIFQNHRWKNQSLLCDPERGDETKASESSKEVQISRRHSVISKETTILSKRTKVTEDRKIGETYFSDPLELVEIYSGKKKRSVSGSLNLLLVKELSDTTQELISMKSFPEESNSGFEIFQDKNPPLAGTRRNNSKEERRIVHPDIINGDISVADNVTKHKTWRRICKEASNASSCSLRNLDVFTEPTRDMEDGKSSTLKIDEEEEKRNAYSTGNKVQETSLSSQNCTRVKDDTNQFIRSAENVERGNNSQKEEQKRIVKRIVERIQHSLKNNTNFIHLNDLTPVDQKFKHYSRNNTVIDEKAENERNNVSNLYLHMNASTDIASDRTCLNLIKDEIPKATTQQSNYLNNTNIGLQSLQDSTNAIKNDISHDDKLFSPLPELKSFSDIKRGGYAFAKQKFKAKASETLQNKRNIEKHEINRNEDYSSRCNRNAYQAFEINDEKKSDRSFANEKRYRTEQLRSTLVAEDNCEAKQEIVGCGDINVCNALAEIHEQLTCNWRKIENRLKVKNLNEIDSTTSTFTIQLLSKIISRCKSYVHNSNDSDLASVVVNKLLSNYVIRLKEIIKRQQVQFLEQQNDEKLEISKNYKCIPSGTISTSQSCKDEISNLIETMSNLIKGIMPRNGEKEGLKSPRKYKSNHRHTWNNVSSHNTNRSKGGALRSVKLNYLKEDSSIETQMGIAENFNDFPDDNKNKICVKPTIQSFRSQGREKIIDDVHGNSAGKKYRDSNRRQEKGKSTKKQINVITMSNQSKQLISRQKHRNCNIIQPVWRPAGVVRVPSSSSVVSLVQKPRPAFWSCGKEKINSFAEQTKLIGNKQALSTELAALEKSVPTVNVKGLDTSEKRFTKICSCLADVKQRRVKSGFNKNLSMEIRSTKGDFRSSVDIKNLKIVNERSNASVNEHLKAKPKTEHAFPSVDLKKSASFEEQNNLSTHEQSIKEQMKNNQDEPTRDTEPKRLLKTMDKDKDVLQTDKKSIVTIVKSPEKLSSIIQDSLNNPDLHSGSKKNEEISTPGRIINSKENSPLDFSRKFVSMANASCTAAFSSSSESTAVAASAKCCQTSFNSLSSLSIHSDENQPCKNDNAVMETITNTSSMGNKENERKRNNGGMKNTFLTKQERQKVFANIHAQSLKMLKDFLCCQGVDVDLVNRAERYLKEKNGIKQRGEKTVKKKSAILSDAVNYDTRRTVSFAPFEGTMIEDKGTDQENRFLRLNSKSEHFRRKRIIQNDKLDVDDYKVLMNDVDIIPRSSLMSSLQENPQNVEGAACNVRNTNDAFSQTDFRCQASKSLQTVPEETELHKVESIAMETQTEVPSVRHISTECQEVRTSLKSVENGKIVSTTTQTVLKVINDASTQNSNSQISKSTTTENINSNSVNLCSKNGEDYVKNCPSNVFAKSVEKVDNVLEKKTTCDNRNTKKSYCNNLRELLDELYEIQNNQTLRNDKKSDEITELTFMNLETESSCSSSSTLNFEQSEKCAESIKLKYESNENFAKNISSKVITAVQIASLRDENFHRAMHIYMANLEEQFARKSEYEADKNILRTGLEDTLENIPEKFRKTLKTNSSIIINNRGNFDKEFSSMTQISKLEIKRVTSHLNSSYSDCRVQTVIKASKSDEISKDINVSLSREVKIPHKSDSWFLCESCNDVVHTYVQSLMEYLICETENENSVRCVRKLSSTVHKRSSMHLHFHDERMEIEKRIPGTTILSRKSLLPLVYGIVCSVVFWCLQFSIKCDFGTLYNL